MDIYKLRTPRTSFPRPFRYRTRRASIIPPPPLSHTLSVMQSSTSPSPAAAPAVDTRTTSLPFVGANVIPDSGFQTSVIVQTGVSACADVL